MTTRLVTAGTGTVAPSATRSGPTHWLEHGPVRLLMDCGSGATHSLALSGLDWPGITHVAITHFHPDHYLDLPALLFALRHASVPPRSAPLTLLGPAGMGHCMSSLAGAFGDWVMAPGFPLSVRTLTPDEAAPLDEGVTLSVHRTPHTDESVALSIATPDGRVVYTGDTGPSEALAEWAAECDLLLAECSLPEHMAIDTHLTPRTAGELAAGARAKRLVLTHLYPPVEEVDVLAEVRKAYGGPAVIARDGDGFEIG